MPPRIERALRTAGHPLLLLPPLLAVLGVPAARAESSALEPPDLEQYGRWGPLRVRPRLELSNVGHDDNIFATSSNEVGDLTATIGPKIDGLALFGHRAFLTFVERLSYTAYRDNPDQNFTNQRLSGRATLPFGRTGLFVEGLMNRLKERPLDAEDVRADRDEDGVGVGLILEPGWRTEIELVHARKTWRYSDPDAPEDELFSIGDRLDRAENRDGVKLRYRLMGRTRLTLAAHVSDIEFDNKVAAGRDSDAWDLMPGVDFGEGGALSGSVRFGRSVIDTHGALQEDFDGTAGAAELAYRPGQRTTFKLEGGREPGFTISSDSTFYVDTRVRLAALYYVTRVVGLEGGSTRARLTFPGASPSFEREDDIRLYDAGLRFRLAEDSRGRRVEYTLRLERYRRDSNDDTQDRQRTAIGAGAVVGF